MVGPCLSVVRKHRHLQSPDGITVSGNMAIAAAAVGRRKDAMMFFHEACLLKKWKVPAFQQSTHDWRKDEEE